MTGSEDGQMWTVGALAEATGLTVRTLHHYDELGLLSPKERTHSGHRRYTEQDVQRLYQIRLLRELGMPLDNIGAVLADPADPADSGALRGVLADHVDQLDDQIRRLDALRRRTRNLLAQLNGSWRPDAGRLLTLLGRMSTLDQHLTGEQRSWLDKRADELGPAARERLDVDWPLVMAKLAEHCRADDPVDDPEVRKTIRRLLELVELFTGDDPGLRQSMVGFFRERGLGISAGAPADAAPGDELLAYLDRAAAALPDAPDEPGAPDDGEPCS